MLIQIFLGEKPWTGYDIKIDKIEENKNLFKVYYSVIGPDNFRNSKPSQPYVIVTTHKSRKPTEFYENGEKVGGESQDIHVISR